MHQGSITKIGFASGYYGYPLLPYLCNRRAHFSNGHGRDHMGVRSGEPLLPDQALEQFEPGTTPRRTAHQGHAKRAATR